MVNKERLEDKIEDVKISITEDEFLFQMEQIINEINREKKEYVNMINQVMKYKSFNFAVNYYYNKTKGTYECDFIKRGKIGFAQSRPYEPSKNMIKKLKK